MIDSDGHQVARARLRRARRRPGAPRLADEGRRRQHAHLEADRAAAEAAASDASGTTCGRASDWVASYLEADRRAAGGRRASSRARSARELPASPPERAEPFADVLRDLDEVIVPGLTLWNHPRFFAYFANTGSEPGILAELLTAALNVNAMAWLTSPAATELEQVTSRLARPAARPAGGLHGHIEDTASTSTLAALAAARDAAAGRRRLRLRAGALLGREGGADPRARAAHGRRSTTSSGCSPTSRSTMRPRSSRPSGRPRRLGRPRAGARRALRRGRRLAARRRRLRRLGGGLPRAPLVPRRRRARRLDRRQPAQVAVHADGLLGALDAPRPRRSARRSRRTATTWPRPRRPSTSATTARRSAGASARSSSGRCCAATAARACRR